MSSIDGTNQELDEQMEQTKTRDVVVAVVGGIVFGVAVFLLLGTGGTTSSGGISPTATRTEGWPILGALAGLVSAGLVARALFAHLRRRRRRRFWGL